MVIIHGTTSDPPPPSPPALVFAALTLVSHTLTFLFHALRHLVGSSFHQIRALESGVGIKVAIFLIQRNRHALIGRAIDDNDMKRVLQFLKNDPVVDAVYDCNSELILNQPVFHVTTGSVLRQVLLMAITSRDTALTTRKSAVEKLPTYDRLRTALLKCTFESSELAYKEAKIQPKSHEEQLKSQKEELKVAKECIRQLKETREVATGSNTSLANLQVARIANVVGMSLKLGKLKRLTMPLSVA
ncbi:hypothetical protein LguiB_009478 [Lonicera macranthoides]